MNGCVCVCVHAHVCMMYSMWCLILVYCLAIFCTNTVFFSADLVLFEGQEAFFKVRTSSCGDSVLFALVSTKASATYFFCTAQYTSPIPRHTFVHYPSPPLTLPLPSPSVHSSSPSPVPSSRCLLRCSHFMKTPSSSVTAWRAYRSTSKRLSRTQHSITFPTSYHTH